jgi:hypothetical protein
MHSHSDAPDTAVALWSPLVETLLDWHTRAQAAQQLLMHVALEAPQAQTTPRPPHSHAHHHSLFERHHHAAGDSSVVALDSAATGSPSDADELSHGATSGVPALPRLLSSALSLPPPLARNTGWPPHAARAWRSAEPRLLKRPPRA